MNKWSERIARFNQFALEYPCMENDSYSYDPYLAKLVIDFQMKYSSLNVSEYSIAAESFLEAHPEIEKNECFRSITVYDLKEFNKYRKEAEKALLLLNKKMKNQM